MMEADYRADLAHIHASGFGDLAATAGPTLVGLLQHAGIDAGLVVDLGCGNGVTSRALSDAGYDVLGIDRSAAMLALARRTAPGARFRRGSFLDTDLPPCRAVAAVGEVFNYTRRNLDPVFRRVHRALEPGGLFVFDLAGPGRVAGREPARYWAEGEDWAILVEVDEDRGQRLLTRRMTTFRRSGRGWRRDAETHSQRLHAASEVAGRLRERGFRVRVRRGYAGERFAAGHYVVTARAEPKR